ncbi:hypothetical protein PIB19_07715 [Sphingomonas sp. 7/4-4]|uniref:hypothetical protein n=1 Tax=Sphingomonas sp. 7/4-4 TaxID=3018446 RepID=UPI0022F38337|nr:hypothetical protein [Sphingomonas sp. 7/4-4]WBY09214.1 hypothetical protein PIB19_07715 [Sphingomonas sp. 7/4-4]
MDPVDADAGILNRETGTRKDRGSHADATGPADAEAGGELPQFILCDAALQQDLLPLISAPTNPEAMEFVQWLQSNPDPAIAAGNVLSPPGTPSTSAVPLDPGLVQALVPVLSYAADSIVDDADFEGVAWTVQHGVAPSKQQTQPTTGGWTLTSQGPIGGLVFSSVVYADGGTPGFTLTLVNDQPRHLSVYARFLKAGMPVAPVDWTSRLPAGVPAGFETATEKYLGMLLPGAKVGAIAVAGGAQQIGVPLPANADSIELLFGGLNDAGYSPIPDAVGVMLTFLLDMAVPWIVQGSGAPPADLAKWFDGVLADNGIAAAAMASGAFLLQVGSRDAMFAALSANLCTALLGTPLAGLRKSIAKKLGSPPGVSYGWVDQFAPGAGWAAQLVQAFTAGGLSPQYWPGATPPIALTLSPATLVALDLSLLPDPVSGIWPYAASACSVEIAYGGGDLAGVAGRDTRAAIERAGGTRLRRHRRRRPDRDRRERHRRERRRRRQRQCQHHASGRHARGQRAACRDPSCGDGDRGDPLPARRPAFGERGQL